MRDTFLVVLLALLTGLLAVPQLAGAICNTPPPAPPRPVPPGSPVDTPGGGTPTGGGRRGVPTPPGRRTGVPTSPFMGYAGSWRIWWDFNREFLLGVRGITKVQVTEGDVGSSVDPMGRYRGQVAEVLRKIALSNSDEELREAALCALGRAGSQQDAELFLRILRAPNQPREVTRGAAIGLANLPRLENEKIREAVRLLFDALLADRMRMPERTRLSCLMALCIRGRHDPVLVRALAKKLEVTGADSAESAAVLYGAGLPRTDLTAPVLVKVLGSGKLGRKNLTDVARAHAALGLALTGGPEAVGALLELFETKNVQVHTRRSAALALGHLLRDGTVTAAQRGAVTKTLIANLTSDADPLVKGYSAIAMGLAETPFSPDPLMATVNSGQGAVKPYAALALGLMVKNLAGPDAERVQEFLYAAYQRAKGPELPGALAVALGLAGAQGARELLASHVASTGVDDTKRAPACQALGLLGVGRDQRLERALVVALNDSSEEVSQHAAIGLGLRGDPESAMLLVKKLAAARSELMQAHMVRGLSHLGGTEVVEPLVKILLDPARKKKTRISAATALGFIISRREHDLLFELDAYTNPYGMTEATRELIQVY